MEDKMKNKILLTVVTALLALAVTACKTNSETDQNGTNPAPNTVTISDNSFGPSPLTVSQGTTVTWTHSGGSVHTVTSGTRDNHTGLFNSGDLVNGDSFQYTFNESGTYVYHCHHHAGMDGVVVVQ